MKQSTSKAVKCRNFIWKCLLGFLGVWLGLGFGVFFEEEAARILKPYCVMHLVDALLLSAKFIYKSSEGVTSASIVIP